MFDIKEIIECSAQEREYPEVRGDRYEHGFDCQTHIGQVLWCIAAHPEINTVLDFFTNTGSGSSLTIAHAQQRSGGNKKLYGVEMKASREHRAKIEKNLEGYSSANILYGSVQNVLEHGQWREQIPEEVDLVCYDPDPPIADWIFNFTLHECRPKLWLMHNINYDEWESNFNNLMRGDEYELVLKSASPELIFREKCQEFALFEKNESIPSS